MKRAVLSALRAYGSEIHLRATAPDRDLRAGRIRVFHVLALDIADLVASKEEGRRTLQRLRADDRLFDIVKEALIGHLDHCKPTRKEIQERAERARDELGGKAVWTEQFLERFAPIKLPTLESISCNGETVRLRSRLSDDPASQLHHVILEETRLQMFRDGTLVFTLRTSFDERDAQAGGSNPPAPVESIIERLAALDSVATTAFHGALEEFLRPVDTRQRLSETLKRHGYEDIELIDSGKLDRDVLRRKAEKHTVIVIERFFKPRVRDIDKVDPSADPKESGIVPLHTVLASSSLAGILNTASWFHRYNSRYVSRLIDKEIGYRDDEIYITDRKATVVSAANIWNENDSLSEYIKDVVLAVEYNVALLAYFASTLAYYQEHQDVRSLEQADPLAALKQVNDGRAILSQMVESLDLTILVDHGFTRLFVERLRAELGFRTAIEFIRQRVEDASTDVGLRSSVNAAENTSRKNLRWVIAGVLVALGLGIAGFFAGRSNVQLRVERGVCVQQRSGTAVVCGEPRRRAE